MVDLLALVLAHVADPEIAFESKLKRHGLRTPYNQISGRMPRCPTNGLSGGTDAVRPVSCESQDLAEQHAAVLTVLLRVALAAAVAQPDVEHAVRPEHHLTAVVVGERLVDAQQLGP